MWLQIIINNKNVFILVFQKVRICVWQKIVKWYAKEAQHHNNLQHSWGCPEGHSEYKPTI